MNLISISVCPGCICLCSWNSLLSAFVTDKDWDRANCAFSFSQDAEIKSYFSAPIPKTKLTFGVSFYFKKYHYIRQHVRVIALQSVSIFQATFRLKLLCPNVYFLVQMSSSSTPRKPIQTCLLLS